jgi:hypothetical protein
VVDPEDLLFAEPAVQEVAEPARRLCVVPEGLLDDDPRPPVVVLPLPDLADARLERLRRDQSAAT